MTEEQVVSLRTHKIANVLGALPKSAHPGAKKALAEIWNAEDKNQARAAATAFEAAYAAKFPKAVAKITDDLEELLAFYDYPAEHWVHLRTTDEIVNPLLGRAGFVSVGAVFRPFAAAA
jgi:transposase-like protein